MRVVGVICEYNPFHNGHALHLRRAREAAGADYVLCLMSGALTQRGAFARHDKWLRARMALLGGADLVLELPARFACAPAPEFARGGMALLASLGVGADLSFGCEADALPLLGDAVRALREEPPAFRAALRRALDAGESFPRAQALAVEAACGAPGLADALNRPNAALALEYLRALPGGMRAFPVAREGCAYHDETLAPLASATAVRAALERGEADAALGAVPFPDLIREAEALGDVHEPGALDAALLYRLRTMDAEALREVPGMDEGLEGRFLAAAAEAGTREALLARVKTRRYPYARLSRLCALALLGVTRALAARIERPGYARILGFRRRALPLLHAMRASASVPLIAKAADFDRADEGFALDLRAQDLWALGCRNEQKRAAGRDLVTSPVIVEE